mgnify:CR=1 FL=1
MGMRSNARRRPPRRRRGENGGGWVGYGALVEDGIRGVRIPLREAVKQRGVWVSRDYRRGALDRNREW